MGSGAGGAGYGWGQASVGPGTGRVVYGRDRVRVGSDKGGAGHGWGTTRCRYPTNGVTVRYQVVTPSIVIKPCYMPHPGTLSLHMLPSSSNMSTNVRYKTKHIIFLEMAEAIDRQTNRDPTLSRCDFQSYEYSEFCCLCPPWFEE